MTIKDLIKQIDKDLQYSIKDVQTLMEHVGYTFKYRKYYEDIRRGRLISTQTVPNGDHCIKGDDLLKYIFFFFT